MKQTGTLGDAIKAVQAEKAQRQQQKQFKAMKEGVIEVKDRLDRLRAFRGKVKAAHQKSAYKSLPLRGTPDRSALIVLASSMLDLGVMIGKLGGEETMLEAARGILRDIRNDLDATGEIDASEAQSLIENGIELKITSDELAALLAEVGIEAEEEVYP